MPFGSLVVLLQLAAATSTDVERVVRDARDAQSRFEFTRRAHLPRGLGGGPGRCDAQIGRFCYWHDDSDNKPPDPPRIVQARNELLEALDSAARLAPASDWIAGQRVRYLIEGGRADAAVAAARECRSARWWCLGLEGLALHVDGRDALAESVFDAALADMPANHRCDWLDLERLADGRMRKELRDGRCEARASAAERLWALSKPLWSRAGNDLRNEHFARQVMASILSRSATAHGTSFGDDSRELLIRYGWPEWFTRRDSPYETMGQVTGHDREPSYRFFPDLPSTQARWIGREAWRLRDTLAQTRYAPRHVKWMGELGHQLARFARGDSMLVAIAYEVRDPALRSDRGPGWLAVQQRGVERATRYPRSVPMFVTLGRDTAIVSVEVVGDSSKRVERTRYSIDAPECVRWCLSDLVLFAARDSARDVPLETAMQAAIAETPVRVGTPLGAYWETGGVDRMPQTVALTVEPVKVGAARRLVSALRLAPPPAAVRLRWEAVPGTGAQSVVVRLPSSARGRYRVHLTVHPRGMAERSVFREIEVR